MAEDYKQINNEYATQKGIMESDDYEEYQDRRSDDNRTLDSWERSRDYNSNPFN